MFHEKLRAQWAFQHVCASVLQQHFPCLLRNRLGEVMDAEIDFDRSLIFFLTESCYWRGVLRGASCTNSISIPLGALVASSSHQQDNSATWSIFSSRRPWDWSPGAHDGPLLIITRSYGSLPFSYNYSTFPPVFPGTAFQITNLHLNFCPWICFWGHPSGRKRHKGELTALNGPWNCKRQAWRPDKHTGKHL